ncbi:MAG: FHA domain-containing protein [Dehalococcoidia bacterium]|nr:FHA domain-containing protein [Dehalococcoidia bacterium]
MKFGSLQVRTPDGDSQEFPLDLPSLVVGRADGNGIVIDDLSVSRRHARIVIESGHLLIEDLGSAAGTFVDGHRIDPHTTNIVEDTQSLRFGDVQAQFFPAPAIATEGDQPAVGPDGAPLEAIEEAPSAAIRIQVTSPLTPVEPGGAAFATAVIQNRGRVVDLVTLGITGIPAAWVTFSQNTLAIVPGTRENVSIIIQPPVSPDSLAGEYDFGVVVNSGEHEREGVDFGKLVVEPFEATTLSVAPVRSRRDFNLTAKNNGNALVSYTLSGLDDEGAFLYDFPSPSIELPPGREVRVPFRVRKRSRKLFGRTTAQPYRIIATPAAGGTTTADSPGQLLVQPPLERWKWPLALLLLLAALAIAFWISWIYRDQIPTWIPWSTKTTAAAAGNPEAAYAGVHMCDKSQEERDKSLAKVKPLPAGSTGAPLFAQNNPAWAKETYAKADDPEFGPDWCGTTIEQCGCAMTSVATVMAIFNILTMPDGSQLTPETVNAWFNEDARKTSRGWVSRGYIYGDVIWTAANELSGQIAKSKPGSPTLRFAGFGVGSDEEIRSELQAGRPIVLEVPGHYIAAVGLDGDKILINDPYYADRKTLDAYKGKVKSSVKFEPSSDLAAVAITVPKDLRVRITDKQGKIVGSLNTDETTSPAPVGIDGAYLSSRDAWRDPTCVESPPPTGAGTTTIFLPGNKDDYRIEVVNPSSGGTSVAIHSYDQDGQASVETRDSTGLSVIGMSYDPAKSGVDLQVIQGTPPGSATTPAGASGTPTLPGGGVPGGGGNVIPNPSATTPTPGVTPSATPTKKPVPTPTPVPPAAVTVKCDVVYQASPPSAGVTCTGSVTGTSTTTRWSINGLPAPVPPGSTAFSTTFTTDTAATVEMTACNVTVCKTGSTPVVVKFSTPTPTPSGTPVPGTPTPTPTIAVAGPPPTVNVTCLATPSGSGNQIDCTTSFVEAYNTILWTTTGPASPTSDFSGAKYFTTYGPATGTITVQAQVCYNSVCTTSNVASVQLGQVPPPPPSPMVSVIDSDLCGIQIDPFNPATISGVVANWDSSKPIPTGTMTWVANGNPIGSQSLVPGENVAYLTITYGQVGFGIPLTVQYSGDPNWLSGSMSCQFDASPP